MRKASNWLAASGCRCAISPGLANNSSMPAAAAIAARYPNWFIEALVAPPALRGAEISGLGKGSERRYGFVRLAGTAQRVALIGSHGTSLYVDFDKRLVVATFASYPGAHSPAELALLEQVWKAVERGSSGGDKRGG